MSAPWVLLALCLSALGPCNAADSDYTLPVLNESYVSNTRFVAHGLAPLYDGVNLFLRGIQQEELLPPDLLVVKDGRIQVNSDIDYQSVAKFYVGILVVLCIGLAVVLLAPCVGLLWCCCRCCGSNTKQRLLDDDDQYHSKTEQPSGGPVLAPLVLSIITCIIVAAVAIALAANAYVENGVGGIGKHITSGTADVRLYMTNAKTEVDTILGDNYNELSKALTSVLKGGTTKTQDIVNEFITSLPLDKLNETANGIEKIQKDLDSIISEIDTCTVASQKIVQEIQNGQLKLNQLCQGLGPNCPRELQELADSMAVPTFNPLQNEDIRTSLEYIKTTIPSDFREKLTEGSADVNNLGTEVENVMNEASTQMENIIKQTGRNLQDRATELLQAVTNTSDTLLTVDEKVSDIQDGYNTSYSVYRISGFTAYIAVILFIAALITLGLVCGSCCSKHSYSFLDFPVVLIILTISVWMAIVMALFITGVATDRACEFLRKPEDHQVTKLVDALMQNYREQMTNGEKLPPLHTISYYIEECRNDKTLYEVIDLESTIRIDTIVENINNFDFNPYLAEVNKTLDSVVQVQLLPPDIQRQIEDLKNSEVSHLSLTILTNELISFQATAKPLRSEGQKWVDDLQKLGEDKQIDVSAPVSELQNIVTTAENLGNSIKRLLEILDKTDTDLKLGHESFPDALQWILDEAKNTQDLVKQSSPRLSELAMNTAEQFRSEVQNYLQWAVSRVKSHALKCRPIIDIYDALVMGVCDEIVSPLNAFWAMAGLCLLLFIPAAFVASSLASHKS